MWKNCACLILIVLTAVSVHARGVDSEPASWLALEASNPGDAARVESVATATAEIRMDLVIPGLETRTVATRGGGPRSLLSIPGAGVTGDPGEPRLPALRYMVEIPPGATVHVELAPVAPRQLSLPDLGIEHALIPVQPPVPKIEGAAERVPYLEHAFAYATDAFLPAEPAVVADLAVLRGRHVALIEVRPVRYNPVARSIEVWSRAQLRVAFENGVPDAALREKQRLASPVLDRWIEREIVARPDELVAAPPAPTASTSASGGALGMLVIVHDSFASAAQPLLDWKEKTGYKVERLLISEIGSNPSDSDVKAEIAQRYAAWSDPPLEFVLLVGDTDFVPIHNGNGGGNSQVTDNWYVCLDGPDYLPEVAIGRISTRSANETTAVVDKLLTYEQATFPTTTWTKMAGFIGTSDSGYIGLIEGTHDDCIDMYYTPNGYLPTAWSHGGASCDRHYNSYNATTSEIAASINEGRSIVNYSGHGGNNSWQGPTSNGGYGTSDVNGNTNDGMYPFVISNACVTGSLDDTECFGETWQKAPNKGAIAFWGASNNSYWDEDDVLQRDLHDNIFPMDDSPPIGVIVNETKLDLYDHYGDSSTVAYYFDMYNLLSEPSLSLWTRAPRDLVVSYPEGLPIGESSFTVGVTHLGQPVAGALVAVRRSEDGVFEAGFTNGAGQAVLLLNPAPVTVGPMEVTVTGHDLRPYEGTTDVISPDTPWLVHRSHVVDDLLGGDGNGIVNPDEEIVFPVTVENVGGQPGTQLQGTLTTSTPQWVAILDGQASFPDLNPGEQGTTLPDHFEVRVSTLAPDGVTLGFDVAWTAMGGASGVTSFSEMVQGINFELENVAVDDATLGNGNGVAGPGETVDLTLTLANVGHRGATGISSVLTSSSPHITILQGAADYPDIPAGGQADSLPPPYSLEIASDAPDQQPVSLTLTVTEAGSGYQQVLLFDLMVSSCATTASADVPKPINDYTTIESTIDYPLAIEIGEVNVFVDITHTFKGDLRVTLESPSGTSVVLHDRSGGGANDIQTWYDTETVPAEPLTAFDGENAFGVWKLIVEDEAGGDQGTLDAWSLELCGEQLEQDAWLEVVGQSLDDSHACNPDGMADVGETVSWSVTVRNEGWGRATGVSATLSTPSNVIVNNNPVLLPTLLHGAEAVAEFEVFIGSVACKEDARFTVVMQANEGSWHDSFNATLEVDHGFWSSVETVEHDGAEPPGWSHSAPFGTDDWQIVDDRNHTALGLWSWFAPDTGDLKDDRLVSPPLELGYADPVLKFWHLVDLHNDLDGGVLEISLDGGLEWADLGPQITVGGYNSILGGSNPIAGRSAWSGVSAARWSQIQVDLAPWAGQTVLFRWRLACDDTAGGGGWWIDDVAIEGDYELCDDHLCGVPGEVMLSSVTRQGDAVVLEWPSDPLCSDFKVWRSADPSTQAAFVNVTDEDPDPTDTVFSSPNGGDLAFYIVVGHGTDGDGPWGHYEP